MILFLHTGGPIRKRHTCALHSQHLLTHLTLFTALHSNITILSSLGASYTHLSSISSPIPYPCPLHVQLPPSTPLYCHKSPLLLLLRTQLPPLCMYFLSRTSFPSPRYTWPPPPPLPSGYAKFLFPCRYFLLLHLLAYRGSSVERKLEVYRLPQITLRNIFPSRILR